MVVGQTLSYLAHCITESIDYSEPSFLIVKDLDHSCPVFFPIYQSYNSYPREGMKRGERVQECSPTKSPSGKFEEQEETFFSRGCYHQAHLRVSQVATVTFLTYINICNAYLSLVEKLITIELLLHRGGFKISLYQRCFWTTLKC